MASKASQLSPNQQKKYLGGLKGAAREARAAEILYRREHRSDKPFVTDEGQPTRRTSHAAAFERKYGRHATDTADAAKLTGIPKKILDEVYARGMAAWQTGHRPGASQHAWALARVYSFATGGPTAQGPDADLAREAQLKNPADQTHIPPGPVAAAARRGLELRASQPPSNRCCTPVGLRRAGQLAARQPVSEDTLRRMVSYFRRHEVDKQGKDWNKGTSKGLQAWLCWGGDEGYAWARRVLGV